MQKRTKSYKRFLPLILAAVVASLYISVGASTAQVAQAQAPESSKSALCKEGSGTPQEPCVNPDVKTIKEKEDANNPNKITCGSTAGSDCGGVVENIVNPGIRIMTGIVGILIAISLVLAAITYGAAGGDPSKVAAAKKRITNTIVALIAYIFMFGLLQWLIPGGVL